MNNRVTTETLRSRKQARKALVGVTAYDYPTAVLADRAGLDIILVGDSLGQLVLGRARAEDTTMDDMVHHCAAVSRGAAHALVVGDMPFGSYEKSPVRAVENAVRLTQFGGAQAVKIEGGIDIVATVEAIAIARIPVIGHLTPLHVPRAIVATERVSALVDAAAALELAGAAAIVLVGLEHETARAVTSTLVTIPSIGYQSGPYCDGQLLITPIMLGLLPLENPTPGPYGSLAQQITDAFVRFRSDVLGHHEIRQS